VGMEACATSHHWSRELQALGHTVRLMPPAYVKPYVKRQKNDATDAEAICEAVTRANMRFVATKTPEQQSGLVLHRTPHLFIRQQTAVINAIRAHLAEFGIVAAVGRNGIEQLLNVVADAGDKTIARGCTHLSHGSRRPTASPESTAPGARPHDHGLASIQRDEQAARCDPGRWSCAGHGAGCQPCRSASVSGRARLVGLDWTGAESSIRVEARTGSAASASKVTVICVACSRQARLLSFAMPRSMAPSIGLGSRRYWRGGPPRSPPLRLPTNSRGWPGP